MNAEANDTEDLCLEAMESDLYGQLDREMTHLQELAERFKKDNQPEALGASIREAVWDQFILQIGGQAGAAFIEENRGLTMDLRTSAHVQSAEDFANGKIATHNTEVDYQERYNTATANFKKDDQGRLIMHTDPKTGEQSPILVTGARAPFDRGRPQGTDGRDVDHIIPVSKLLKDPAVQAYLTPEEQVELANHPDNLQLLSKAANISKGGKTIPEWLASVDDEGRTPDERFEDVDRDKLIKAHEKAKKLIEKAKKEAEERARTQGRKSQWSEAARFGYQALRAMAVQLCADFVKGVFAAFVVWLKTTARRLKDLLVKLKEMIVQFVRSLKERLIGSVKSFASTLVSAIFGPISNLFRKLFTLIKQGAQSLIRAVKCLFAPENRGKPFGEVLIEASKIIVAGLGAAGAVALGQLAEGALLAVCPALAFSIPLLGSVAGILGMLLGAVVAGLLSAIVLNMLDRLLAKKRRERIHAEVLQTQGRSLSILDRIFSLKFFSLFKTKYDVGKRLQGRHERLKVIEKRDSVPRSEHNRIQQEIDISLNKNKSLLDELSKD